MQHRRRIIGNRGQVEDAVDSFQQTFPNFPLVNASQVFTDHLEGLLHAAQMSQTEVADIDDADLVSAGQKLGNQYGTKIACAAGDENVHTSSLSASTRASTT